MGSRAHVETIRVILLIGDSPGRSPTTEEGALGGRNATRLAELASVDRDRLLELTCRVNLVDDEAEYRDPKALQDAALRVAYLVERIDADYVVVLGERAASALGLGDAALFEWTGDRPMWARAPHPSGRNRYWNDPERVEVARDFWRDLFATSPDLT